jgi:hypothetical protein
MKKCVLVLLFILSICDTAICQQFFDSLAFRKLSLEDQLQTYFDTYRDGHSSLQYPRYASYIVGSYGIEVIPRLKEYLKNADMFSLRKNWPSRDVNRNFYAGEPNDITMELIASIWSSLHVHDNLGNLQPYTLDEREIQWFIDEYKQRIDDYVLAVRVIDETMLASERMLYMIANYGKGIVGVEKYGHPNFGIAMYNQRGRALKEYYEQRLGIDNLTIDYNVFVDNIW